ncbi:hypothetical protein DEIPH_ctg001orf0055 [Deinococcus phoenicis]|uniref:Uncharacterized protein n=1 Tax=Deinococcus phoenicis TaxID=1476583 RepID=A0A016QUM4_9DEIO|nr:hypothetical protein [Deinococcus phoenicis]EYB69835.1 hypothetical protein DEIPH_ctg001orf0055 [Deinococcus phoenicis]
MLTLQGKYHVAQNKRLTIFAEPRAQQAGTLDEDIQALREACEAAGGCCDVHVLTQHGLMRGTLTEKKPKKFNLWQFEGHLSFPPRA